MIKIDLQRQWQRGRQVSLESYLETLPELGSRDTIPADLILAEYEARSRSGAPAELSQFEARFPAQAQALRRLVESQPQESSTISFLDQFDPVADRPSHHA